MSRNPAISLQKLSFGFHIPEKIIPWLLFIGSIIFFMQGLDIHGIEYRDDEIFYYRSTSEMVAQGNYLSPTYFGENRFQKPIFFYWLIILSYQIFGQGWFAARFVSVVFAGLTMAVTWAIGRELFDKKTATLSCLILASVPLFFRHAKNAVPDMALNFFIVGALYCLLKFFQDPSRRIYGNLFFISCGLGFMIKGFAAVVIPCVSCLILSGIQRRGEVLRKINFPFGLLILAVIVLPWFLFMVAKHGGGYLYYVLHAETLERAVSTSQEGSPVFKIIKIFFTNAAFYIRTIFSYFAPWCLFLVGAIPFAVNAVIRKKEKNESFLFLLVWFLVGFLFFSLIASRINHLILAITTPFALLLSGFFLIIFERSSQAATAVGIFTKTIVVVLAGLGFLGLMFIRVILLGGSVWWVWAFLLIFTVLVLWISKTRDYFVVPLALAGVALLVLSHSTLLSKAGLVSLSSLQEITATVNRQIKPGEIFAVGSHDIHEKELQIYFNDPVLKAATSIPAETREKLKELFQSPRTVYCLFTEDGYRTFLKDSGLTLQVLKENLIFRRRIYPDKKLFQAFLEFDRLTVQRYFMEKIILVVRRAPTAVLR